MINGRQEIALVDVAIVREQFVGARAVWKPESLCELFVTFGAASSIGLSSVVGLLAPVTRNEPFGRRVLFADPGRAPFRLAAPVAPGLIEDVGIERVETVAFDTPMPLTVASGSIALDGEREITFSERDLVQVTLRKAAFRTIDISACMSFAASKGLFLERTRQAASAHPAKSHVLGGQG
jgi:hypothetical protein